MLIYLGRPMLQYTHIRATHSFIYFRFIYSLVTSYIYTHTYAYMKGNEHMSHLSRTIYSYTYVDSSDGLNKILNSMEENDLSDFDLSQHDGNFELLLNEDSGTG